MTNTELDSGRVEDEIRQAFEPLSKPLVMPEDMDGSETSLCEQNLAGYDWQSIPLEKVLESFDCISFLDDEAFACMLPAWMIAALHYPAENVYHWTLSALLSRSYIAARCSSNQINAIQSFLHYVTVLSEQSDLEMKAYAEWSTVHPIR